MSIEAHLISTAANVLGKIAESPAVGFKEWWEQVDLLVYIAGGMVASIVVGSLWAAYVDRHTYTDESSGPRGYVTGTNGRPLVPGSREMRLYCGDTGITQEEVVANNLAVAGSAQRLAQLQGLDNVPGAYLKSSPKNRSGSGDDFLGWL